MKQVFEVEMEGPTHITEEKLMRSLKGFYPHHEHSLIVRDVTTEPVEDASTGIKKIFEIEYKKGHQPVVSHEMKSMLASYTTGLVGVKDVSKDVAILRDPKPLGWREAGPAPNAEEETAQHIPDDGGAMAQALSIPQNAEMDKMREHIEQLKAQLERCGAAANWTTKVSVAPGDYSYSSAYGHVIDLRRKYDNLMGADVVVPGSGKPEEEEAQPPPHGRGSCKCAKWADRTQEIFSKKDDEIKQLERQLTVCTMAAKGPTKDVAMRGDYGWSQAYEDVLDLRRRYEQQLADVATPDLVNEYRDEVKQDPAIGGCEHAAEEALKKQAKSSILLSESVELWYCMSEGPTVTFEGFCNDIASAGITIKNDLPGVES